ncbi:MAG: hypothetical protein Q7T39_25685, partial [Polaromonas sp.]|nr:hypothetical protein [Polaromonas sp.]
MRGNVVEQGNSLAFHFGRSEAKKPNSTKTSNYSCEIFTSVVCLNAAFATVALAWPSLFGA